MPGHEVDTVKLEEESPSGTALFTKFATSVLEAVQQYNGEEQFDDVTLIIAKCKE